MKTRDVVILGGGSAGLSAALTCYKNGIKDILILERDQELGCILQQCIHNGFGLHTFNEELSGPSYAERFIEQIKTYDIEVKLNTLVTHIREDKVIEYVNQEEGYCSVQAKAIILAMGCYERTRGSITLGGARPAGVYNAGTAQRYLNMEGYLVGKKVFILGSGDIGLIMARRMTLEGAEVYGVAELMPYSNGLPRNIKQCLDDFDIPLYLSHTVSRIEGKDRVEAIEISQVDEQFKPIKGTEKRFEVDTLLLSVGLIPENSLSEEANIELHPRTRGPIVSESYMTSVEGIFACGNGLHVHDLVDFVTLEGTRAANGVTQYLNGLLVNSEDKLKTNNGNGIGYVLPHLLNLQNIDQPVEFLFRVTKNFKNTKLVLKDKEHIIKEIKKAHMAPAEMEHIKLTLEELKLFNQELTIEVVE